LAGEGKQRDDLDVFTMRMGPHRIQKEAYLHQFTIALQDFFNTLQYCANLALTFLLHPIIEAKKDIPLEWEVLFLI